MFFILGIEDSHVMWRNQSHEMKRCPFQCFGHIELVYAGCMRTNRLHKLHESKPLSISCIEFIRSKLSNFSAHVSAAYVFVSWTVDTGQGWVAAGRDFGSFPFFVPLPSLFAITASDFPGLEHHFPTVFFR